MPPPPQNTVQESWTPEPELRDSPPRRIGPSDYPDLNQVNVMLFLILGGVLVAVGFVLLVVGLIKVKVLFDLGGIMLALGGTALLVIFPQKQKAHLARAEHLVANGIPVAARVLSSDNLTGDSTYGRAVKYQVTLPGGEMAHRSVNADERALPKRVPGDTTALIDVATGDVELYCALPFRAVAKNPLAAPASADPFGTVIPTAAPTMASTVTPPPAPAAPVAPTLGGPFGDRLPSSAPLVGSGEFGDRLPSKTPASAPVAAVAPTPVQESMGTISAPPRPIMTDEELAAAAAEPPIEEKTPPAPKTPEAAPQTWE